ncbi:hypothetical protein R9C00_25315 [Flammeovirgaceae bacterium SG7u.111]|nr:hypothetical protein [Flammeovirgaceae bacterium SG7u.132]WPO35016.1 hypothetical protein R9C00_25315 [Flammeovirgaceae bacterium SG7u.111]
MKKLFISIIIAIISTSAFAQAPEKMSYQAVVRNANNELVTNETVGIQFSILQTSISGTAVYVETQSPTTNSNGLISLEIGRGNVISGTFSSIDWSKGPYFIKSEIDPQGGTSYTITGTSQLMSVPYALHAKTAESIIGGITEVDGSVTNEIQDLKLEGNNLTITNNGTATTIDLSPYLDDTNTQLTEAEVDALVANNGFLTAEVDGSVTNEIELPAQTGNSGKVLVTDGTSPAWSTVSYNDLTDVPASVSFDGNFSSLTGVPTGLSDGDDDTQLTETEVDTYVANNGFLTAEMDGSVTNEIQDLKLVGNNLTITNNGTPTTIDLSPYLDNTDTQLTETEVDTYVANNGFLTAEVDGSVTNEIQDLKLVGNNLTITNNGTATTIDLSPYLDNTDTQLTETQVDAYVANNGFLTAEVDGSVTNEIELPAQTGQAGKFLTTNGSSPSWETPTATPTSSVRTISANTTLTTTDEIVFINGAFTATLPASPVDGQRITLCSTNQTAGLNGNGKLVHIAGTSLSSLTFMDASNNMFILIYSSAIGAWMTNY